MGEIVISSICTRKIHGIYGFLKKEARGHNKCNEGVYNESMILKEIKVLHL